MDIIVNIQGDLGQGKLRVWKAANGPFNAQNERWNGRATMKGLVALLITEKHLLQEQLQYATLHLSISNTRLVMCKLSVIMSTIHYTEETTSSHSLLKVRDLELGYLQSICGGSAVV